MPNLRWIMDSPAHLEALGGVVAQGAALEGEGAFLLQATHRQLGRPAPETYKWPWSTLKANLADLAASSPAPSGEVAARLDRADGLDKERSRYTHSEWLLSPERLRGWLCSRRAAAPHALASSTLTVRGSLRTLVRGP